MSLSVWKGARVGPQHGVAVGAASRVAPGWRRYLLGRKLCAMHPPSCCDESQLCATEHRIPERVYPLPSQPGCTRTPYLILAREQIFTEAEQCVRAELMPETPACLLGGHLAENFSNFSIKGTLPLHIPECFLSPDPCTPCDKVWL